MKVGDSIIVFGKHKGKILQVQGTDDLTMVQVIYRIKNRSYTTWFCDDDLNIVTPPSRSSKINYIMTVSLSSVLVGQLAILSGINILLSTVLSLTVGV